LSNRENKDFSRGEKIPVYAVLKIVSIFKNKESCLWNISRKCIDIDMSLLYAYKGCKMTGFSWAFGA
jgi:hypothetical protein